MQFKIGVNGKMTITNKKCIKCGATLPLSYTACPYCGTSQLGIEEETTLKSGKKTKKILNPIVG